MMHMDNDMQALRRMARALCRTEGENQTTLPYLTAYRFTETTIPMPQAQPFYVYFVLDGAIRLYTPSGMMDYIPGQYSVSEIDTPLSGRVLTFSEKKDFIALAIAFTWNDVVSVVLELDGDLAEKIANADMEDDVTAQADADVIAAVGRLLAAMDKPMPLAFLGRHIRREILFYILCGSCGSQFLQSMIHMQQAGEIYEVNRWIKEHFRDSFTVEQLAEQRSMSVSLFHQRFKNAVGMGPLQCQKRLRLTEARRLMLDEGCNVTEASLEVGYESVSQFTRDYRKLYGYPPKEDIRNLRKQIEKQANFL